MLFIPDEGGLYVPGLTGGRGSGNLAGSLILGGRDKDRRGQS